MENSSSKRQQINTELAVRGANKRIKKVIRQHTPVEEQDNLKIDFYCECSDPNCLQRLSLTMAEYERLHDEQSKFIVVKGHNSPEVEKVIATKYNLQVVDKYAL